MEITFARGQEKHWILYNNSNEIIDRSDRSDSTDSSDSSNSSDSSDRSERSDRSDSCDISDRSESLIRNIVRKEKRRQICYLFLFNDFFCDDKT